ncbi:hypothetical protein VUR80DRAFT_5780 [Thermomyces stellatus]
MYVNTHWVLPIPGVATFLPLTCLAHPIVDGPAPRSGQRRGNPHGTNAHPALARTKGTVSHLPGAPDFPGPRAKAGQSFPAWGGMQFLPSRSSWSLGNRQLISFQYNENRRNSRECHGERRRMDVLALLATTSSRPRNDGDIAHRIEANEGSI